MFDHRSTAQYDLVYSLGFTEHFTDVEGVLQKHIDLVADDGLLVLEAPNFNGAFQNFFHRTFSAESLAKHHLSAIDTKHWIHYLESQNFEIVYEGYFGPFSF